VTVGVYDNSGTTLEISRGPYSIALSLSPTGTFSGTTTASTSGTPGFKTFSNLRILTWNTFTLTASSTSITSAVSAQFTTINYVHTIAITSSTSTPSVNFAFTLTFTIKGEDTNAFTGVCSLSLSESGNSLAGSLTGNISGGSGNLVVYFTTSGSKTVVATCPSVSPSSAVTATINLTALKLKLVITSFTAPTHSLTVFSMTVKVNDNGLASLETLRGPYTLTLSLSPVGTILGSLTTTTAVSTAQGDFSGLRILSANTYTLTVSSTDMISATTSSFNLVNFAYTIELQSSNLTPSLNFGFVITATVKGEDGNLFPGACIISLSTTDSSLVGELSKPITNSVSLQTVYFTSIGASKTITATCPASSPSPAIFKTIQVTCLINKLTVTLNNPLVTYN